MTAEYPTPETVWIRRDGLPMAAGNAARHDSPCSVLLMISF